MPAENGLRVRVVASRGFRVAPVAEQFGLGSDEAARRIIRTESNRRAFVRKYFYADIADPVHYDLVINAESMGIGRAVETVIRAFDRD